MNSIFNIGRTHEPWNKGKLIGQKAPLKLQEIWAIRIRLQMSKNCRELAMFNLAIDSKLRGCDLVRLRVSDVSSGSRILKRTTITQRKTDQPVQFEITKQTRQALTKWIEHRNLLNYDYLFPSRVNTGKSISTRQYARIVKRWVEGIGLDSTAYGTLKWSNRCDQPS